MRRVGRWAASWADVRVRRRSCTEPNAFEAIGNNALSLSQPLARAPDILQIGNDPPEG
jgi:hypothetical protein